MSENSCSENNTLYSKKSEIPGHFVFSGAVRGYFHVRSVWLCQHCLYWDHAGSPRRHGAQPEIRPGPGGGASNDCWDRSLLHDRLHRW